jgi:hypothetical protein
VLQGTRDLLDDTRKRRTKVTRESGVTTLNPSLRSQHHRAVFREALQLYMLAGSLK